MLLTFLLEIFGNSFLKAIKFPHFLKKKYFNRESDIQNIDDIYYFIWNKVQYSLLDEISFTYILMQDKKCSFATARIVCELLRNLGYPSKVRIVGQIKKHVEKYFEYVLFYKNNQWYLLKTDSSQKVVIPIQGEQNEFKFWKTKKI